MFDCFLVGVPCTHIELLLHGNASIAGREGLGVGGGGWEVTS